MRGLSQRCLAALKRKRAWTEPCGGSKERMFGSRYEQQTCYEFTRLTKASDADKKADCTLTIMGPL